jgi:hypothetical protein
MSRWRVGAPKGDAVPIRITNTSRGLLTLEFNSGETLHLAPRETSESIEDIEVVGNSVIERLRDQAAITVERPKREAKASREAKAGGPDKGTSQE